MKKTIPLSELIISDEFLEGSALYHSRSVILLSKKENSGTVSVKGKNKKGSSGTIDISFNENGKIIKKSCPEGCGGVCRHMVALSLLYNEMAVEDTDLLGQLSSLNSKGGNVRTVFPAVFSINGSDIQIHYSKNDNHLSRLIDAVGNNHLATLISLFPDKFVYNSMKLELSTGPFYLFYSIDKGTVSFFFMTSILFFENEGVAIDTEKGLVFRFSPGISETLNTLINITMDYTSRDELIKAIADLNDNLAPEIMLTGELNLIKIDLDDDTPVIFDVQYENGRLEMKVMLDTGKETIEFRQKRKNFEQNYTSGGKVYSLSAGLIKKIRSGISASGFRLNRDVFQAPVSKLAEIMDVNNAVNSFCKVVTRGEFRKITINESVADETEIVLDINSDEKWFSFNIRLPESAGFINSAELFSAVRQFNSGIGDPVVIDVDGNPVVLEKSSGFLNRISELVFSDSVEFRDKMSTAHLLKLLKTKNKKIINSFQGAEDARIRYFEIVRSLSEGTLPELKLDNAITSAMRPYQIDGLKWLLLLRDLGLGGILADEMGLGKTLQSLAMIKSEPEDFPSMVVCPKTLIWSWDREISKFFPEMKRTVIDSLKPEERVAKWKNAESELIITSYAVVINDFAHLKDKQFRTVIIDEAQHIKNNNTKRFKTLTAIKSFYRFALTGTPLENHISDLWSIFQFVMPDYLGSKKDINRTEKTFDTEKLNKLSTLTAPFILRRTKREILKELPELIVKEYPVEMTSKQKEIYLSVLLRGRAEFLEKKDSMNKIEMLSILSRLRLAANHPALAAQIDDAPDLSGKVATVLELVDEIILGEGRVLIFSQYVKMLNIISRALFENNIEYLYMDGGTKNRIELVDQFNNGKTPVFLLSLKVGGVGLNLTGADNVIIVDPWWNPAAEEQAWSRAHRIGQDKKVVVNKLFSKGTIEERILDMHQRKRGITDFFMSKSLKEPDEDFIKMIADLELAIHD
ncbi:MAG TPA: DEAD/DEAH box helicase [bacterium]|nr:DEAD/DEAH box helicase [bacterium]HPS29059.1 DEAD/DEAH box helicase [bacterium]